VAPLARLNVSDGMSTPLAQVAHNKMYETLGGKPAHNTLATHWARLIEALNGAERMKVSHRELKSGDPCLRDEDCTGGEVCGIGMSMDPYCQEPAGVEGTDRVMGGEDCNNDTAICYNQVCLGQDVGGTFEGTCYELCDPAKEAADATCAAGNICGSITVGTPDGGSVELSVCVDGECTSDADCTAPEECDEMIFKCVTPNSLGLCDPDCEGNLVCGKDADGDEYEDLCLTDGTNSYCGQGCSGDGGECPTDYVCTAIGTEPNIAWQCVKDGGC